MPRRARHYRLGLLAETVSMIVLCMKGYHILARRFRTPLGEIDLIAKRGKTIAFIEVKARNDRTLLAESVSTHQKRRIAKAATYFLASRPQLTYCTFRFDIYLVSPWHWPQHIKNAWESRE